MKHRRDHGSIYRTPDGRRWFARVRYTDAAGRRRERKRTCLTHAKAKDAVLDLQFEIDRELAGQKTYREVDQFFRIHYVHAAKFVGGKKISGFRQDKKTVERYLDRALEFFGDLPIDAITYADLRRYKLAIERLPARDAARSVSDVNHHLKRVRRLFKVAIEQGWLAVDPFGRGSPLIVESFEVERTRILSPAEETRLLAACDRWRKHIVPVIVLAIETGMRRGEILKLRWSAIDLAARVIRVEAANTKTLKARLVPISLRLRGVLSELRSNRLRPNDLLFGGMDWRRAFNTAARDAKLGDLHFHDLRHTAITRMLAAGVAPPLVMKISGHSQMKTFLRYVNQSESSILAIADLLDRAA